MWPLALYGEVGPGNSEPVCPGIPETSSEVRPEATDQPSPAHGRNHTHSATKVQRFPCSHQMSPALACWEPEALMLPVCGGEDSRVQTGLKHPFLEVSVCSSRGPQTALGSAQTPVYKMYTGSENQVDLFPANCQCDQSLPKPALLVWPRQAPQCQVRRETRTPSIPSQLEHPGP